MANTFAEFPRYAVIITTVPLTESGSLGALTFPHIGHGLEGEAIHWLCQLPSFYYMSLESSKV